MSLPLTVRWMWAFLDAPCQAADATWEFWGSATRSTLSPRRGDDGEFATFAPAYGDPWIKVQRVGGRGRVHLDLDVDEPRAAAAVAAALGDRGRRPRYVVMRSPGGFPFCFTHPHGESDQVRQGQVDLLDQVSLDLPVAVHAMPRSGSGRPSPGGSTSVPTCRSSAT